MEKINKYSNIFSPFKIGNITLKNRVIFPAFTFNYANANGTVSEKLIDIYARIAEGEPSIIIVGGAECSYDSFAFSKAIRIEHDKYIPGLKKIFDEIKKQGVIAGFQIMHAGRQMLNPTDDVIAPSAIPCPFMSELAEKLGIRYNVREMNNDDIKRVQDDLVNGAFRAVKAGAQLIELNAAHGYLLGQFLSPYSNKRNDKYGGSVENRTRFICEIIKKIKEKYSESICISVRVSGNEFVTEKGGLIPSDYKEILPFLEDAGMDMLNVSVSVLETIEKILPEGDEVSYQIITEEIKKYTKVPVAVIGGVRELEIPEMIIADGKADLIAAARAQIADHHFVKKYKTGDDETINKCIQCNKCAWNDIGDNETHCSVNKNLGPILNINIQKPIDIYFFKKDGLCKFMKMAIRKFFRFHTDERYNHPDIKQKYYINKEWIVKPGANLKFLSDGNYLWINNIKELPEGAGVFNVAYDGNLKEIEELNKKGVPIFHKICPWMILLKKELLNIKENYQCVLLIGKEDKKDSHIIFRNYNSIVPEDTIVIDADNYKKKLSALDKNRPVHFLPYPTFRNNEVDQIIKYIKTINSNTENIYFKKSLCCWSNQGLLEEIEFAINNKKLDQIWIICSNKNDRSTISITNQIKENNCEIVFIKDFDEIPKITNNNKKIGVLIAPVPHLSSYEIKGNIYSRYSK